MTGSTLIHSKSYDIICVIMRKDIKLKGMLQSALAYKEQLVSYFGDKTLPKLSNFPSLAEFNCLCGGLLLFNN